MSKLHILLMSFVVMLAPAEQAILAVLALSICDLISAIAVSIKNRPQGQSILQTVHSNGIKRTVIKVAVYEVATILAFVVGLYLTGPEVPVMKWVTSLIGLTELKSVLENLDLLSNGSFFKMVTSKIQSTISDEEKDLPK